jgi:hypothetical protein
MAVCLRAPLLFLRLFLLLPIKRKMVGRSDRLSFPLRAWNPLNFWSVKELLVSFKREVERCTTQGTAITTSALSPQKD